MDKVNIALSDIVEYQSFRRNPGPVIMRASAGRPMLVIKGRKKVVMLDAAEYEMLVQRASNNADVEEKRTGTDG
jgi:PHD/YefM family antitoxin component YafN of YafNO toxin-antitoxin module